MNWSICSVWKCATGDGEQVLTKVEYFFSDDDVFEVELQPDAEIETFFVSEDPSCSFCRNNGLKPVLTRRSL